MQTDRQNFFACAPTVFASKGRFRYGGVEIAYDPDGRGSISLPIREFGDRLFPHPRNGTARLDIRTSFTDDGQESDILGTLGGAVVEVAIGADMGVALPVSIETLSHPPNPF